ELRTHTDVPVCIGFGISNAETVAHVCEVADGAIVGSALIHRITDAKDAPRNELVKKIGDFVGELISPIL
ncbi:MAG: tryptophan synthase subunit alpha, partial [Planctomycetota bacterium]|nr:tryptophan synthase subunit alpha [Planctomycetota bacterium]